MGRATAACAACLLLLTAFVCFEVLDLDGSDFSAPPRTAMTLKVGDAEHDLRRAALQPVPSQPLIAASRAVAGDLHIERRVQAAAAHVSLAPLRPALRDPLARSLLPDPAPSA